LAGLYVAQSLVVEGALAVAPILTQLMTMDCLEFLMQLL
jgi:hypothetical protein